MFAIIVGSDKNFRHSAYTETVAKVSGGEVIVLDDTMSVLADMEQYMYPSLFETLAPVVHAKYVLGMNTELFTIDFAKKLAASPTLFIFEEIALGAPVLTLAKKHATAVHAGEKVVAKKKESDIFAVTNALTAKDKKSRWLAFHASLAHHPIEAIMGILYWKVRDMALRGSTDAKYMYQSLMNAHARSFQTGAPLALLVEKVILE